MTRSEMIDTIARTKAIPRKRAEQVIRLLFDTMGKALLHGERIEIRGFGSFRAKHYPAYTGRNPKTGRVIEVEEKILPVFKVGKELRLRINPEDEPVAAAVRRRRGEG